jgi:CRISPR-associated protein Csm4
MKILRAQLIPRAAFGTPPKGDSLFGQLCWAVRHRFGENRLAALLACYTTGEPFLVVSDALPADHLPRPVLPGHWFAPIAGADRKAVKKRRWLPLREVDAPLDAWLQHCVTDRELLKSTPEAADRSFVETHPQPHNTLSRATGTTGRVAFAPYQMEQHWHAPGARLDLWLVHDPARISRDEIAELLDDMGAFGFGRDASIGLGKFEVASIEPQQLPAQPDADACLTLAPCAPQGLGWQAERSFYQPFTRFGRHGDVAVQSGRPFKNPVLLAQTGAVLSPHTAPTHPFVGRGLGAEGWLSRAIAGTVHQGYAPVVAVRLPERGARA